MSEKMDPIKAANQARKEALDELNGHIVKLDRSLKKYGFLKESQLTAYVPAEEFVSNIETRTGGRSRLATLNVDCDTCHGWEVEILGGEKEIIHKKKNLLFCEHGSLVTQLTNKPPKHQPVRPIKQLYLKVSGVLPRSQFSSNTSDVSPEKLEGQVNELNTLESMAKQKHFDLDDLIEELDFEKEPNKEELERRWAPAKMKEWLDGVAHMVEDIRERAREVQAVMEETNSMLNSPRLSVDSQEARRLEFEQRVQLTGESGFDADDSRLLLGGGPGTTGPLTAPTTSMTDIPIVSQDGCRGQPNRPQSGPPYGPPGGPPGGPQNRPPSGPLYGPQG